MSKHKNVCLFVLFLIVSFFLYGNTLKGEFVYDDYFFLDRPELRRLDHLINIWFEPMLPNAKITGLYRPLATTSFSLNLILFGTNTFPFHLVSIVLNGINCFLVFLITKKLFKDDKLAIIVSLIYAFFPIHTEAVAYIKARDEVMSTTFVLLAWLSFIWGVYREKINYKFVVLSSFLLVLGIFSKELVVMSGLAFFVIYFVQKSPKLVDFIKIGLAYSPIVLASIALRVYVLGNYAFGVDDIYYVSNPLKAENFPVTLWTGFKIAYTYVSKTFLPFNLSSTYHLNYFLPSTSLFDSWQVVAGLIMIVLGAVFLIYKKTRISPLGIGFILFFISYFTFSQFLFNAGDIVGERWIYFSSLGLAMISGYIFYSLIKFNKYLGLIVFSMLLMVYTLITIPRNNIWLSNEALHKGMIVDAPNSIQGYYSLALIYMNKGEAGKASEYVNKAMEIYDKYPPAINLLANIEFRKGNIDKVEELLKLSIEVDPTMAQSYLLLGGLYYAQARYDEALSLFKMNYDLSRKPKIAEVAFYAAALSKLGKCDEAIDVILTREEWEIRQSREIQTVLGQCKTAAP